MRVFLSRRSVNGGDFVAATKDALPIGERHLEFAEHADDKAVLVLEPCAVAQMVRAIANGAAAIIILDHRVHGIAEGDEVVVAHLHGALEASAVGVEQRALFIAGLREPRLGAVGIALLVSGLVFEPHLGFRARQGSKSGGQIAPVLSGHRFELLVHEFGAVRALAREVGASLIDLFGDRLPKGMQLRLFREQSVADTDQLAGV